MKRTNATISCLTLAAFAALATTTLDAAAVAGGDKDREIATKTFVISGDGPSAKAEAHTFEITMDNGELSMTIDGKDLSSSQFRVEDGQVVILDEGAPNVMVGVHLDDPDEALLYHLRLEKGQTTMIRGLYEGLPAHQAGIGRFDIIVAVDGQQPADPKSIVELLADKEPGDHVKFTVIHEGRTKEYSVTLVPYDAARMRSAKLIGSGAFSSRIFIPDEGEILRGLPQMKDFEILIDPETQQRFKRLEQFRLPEGFHEELREQLREGLPRNLDERMDTINDRIAEMQEMINDLVEQARRLAEEAEENENY
jgi:hypothetical protein